MKDEGVAVMTEYVLLLSLSVVIFMAICLAFSTFYGTASADARRPSSTAVAASMAEKISDVVADGGTSASDDIVLPESLGGSPYVIFASGDGKSVLLLAGPPGGTEKYAAPLCLRSNVTVKGLAIGGDICHRVDYDAASRTVNIC
jgi:hypothetical protein